MVAQICGQKADVGPEVHDIGAPEGRLDVIGCRVAVTLSLPPWVTDK